MVLNFRGQLDSLIPEFVEMALTRLTKKTTLVELRMMCLQVKDAHIILTRLLVINEV